MKTIYIFSSPLCNPCKRLKKRLDEESIPYVDIDKTLPENKELWDDVVHQTDSNATPLLIIQDENNENSIAYLSGEDWKSHEELIEIIKKNI